MKINITESVNTALDAGRLMLALALGHGRFHVRNVKVLDYGRSEATIGSVRTVDLHYQLHVGDAFLGTTTRANVRVSLRKHTYIWDADSKENYVCLELFDSITYFKWNPGFEPVITRITKSNSVTVTVKRTDKYSKS